MNFFYKENINYLNSIKELVQLEHDYLSSPEKLLNYNNLYLDNDLQYTSRENIEFLNNNFEFNFKTPNLNE